MYIAWVLYNCEIGIRLLESSYDFTGLSIKDETGDLIFFKCYGPNVQLWYFDLKIVFEMKTFWISLRNKNSFKKSRI